MRRLFLTLGVLALLLLDSTARAVLPQEQLADPALEARARALSQELRCQVCQNQSIDDSNAPLAADLRRLVRERIVAGDSDAEIIAFLVRRYGDNVLLRPPVKPATWPLWYGPAVILVLAAGGLVWWFARGRRRAVSQPPPLSPEEERRLAALLDEREQR